jgi:hypothetical protein
MRSNFADLGKRQNILKFEQVMDVFSQQGGPIELILFVMGQASPDTSLEYPQHSSPTTLTIQFFGGYSLIYRSPH